MSTAAQQRAAGASIRDNLPLGAEPTLPRQARDDAARVMESELSVLVGPPGIGKTRLAIDAGRSLLEREVVDEVWFLDLGAMDTVEGLLRALGDAARIHSSERSTDADLEHVGRTLASRGNILVVFDDADGAIELARGVVERWRPIGVHFCLTARTDVWPEAETFECPPMTADEGAALILERMARLRPNHAITERDREVARTIAEKVDGVPLALEIAASMTLVMGLDDVATRLGRGSLAGAVEETMQTTWETLSPSERRALRWCASFAGTFDTTAFEAIWNPPAEAIGLLSSLRRRSMLSAVERGGRPRLRVLRPIADFVCSREEPPDEAIQVKRCEHYAALAKEGVAASGRTAELRIEFDNLLRAYRRAIQLGRVDLAAPLFLALREVLWARNWAARVIVNLGREFVARFPEPDPQTARVRLMLGASEVLDGDRQAGRAQIERAYDEAQEFDPAHRCEAALRRAWLEWISGNAERGLEFAAEAARIADEHDDEEWIARSAWIEGNIMTSQEGPYDETARRFDDAIRRHHRLGHELDEAHALSGLATLCAARGQPGRARQLQQRALDLFDRHDVRPNILKSKHDLASYALDDGMLETAEREAREALRHAQAAGVGPVARFSARLLVASAIERDDWAAFGEAVERLRDLGATSEHPTADAIASLCIALGEWIRGDVHACRDCLRRTVHRFDEIYERDIRVALLALSALTALELGEDPTESTERLRDESANVADDTWAARLTELTSARLSLDDHVDTWDTWEATLRDARALRSYWIRLFVRGLSRHDPTPVSRALAAEGDTGALVFVPRSGLLRPPDAGWTDLSSREQLLSLLDALIERREGLTLDEIQATLWPEEIIEPRSAKARVQNAVSMLRKTGTPVELDAGKYQLPRDLDVRLL